MEESNGEVEVERKEKTKHKGKHDKPKPWDDPSIDHWKVDKFDPSWNEGGMLEVSSFSTLFPQYRGLSHWHHNLCLLPDKNQSLEKEKKVPKTLVVFGIWDKV